MQPERVTSQKMFRFIAPGLLAWVSLFSNPLMAGEVIDNDANATLMASQAKSLVGQVTKPATLTDHHQKMRDNRGSRVTDMQKEADCGGIAIGNVRPVPGDHRQHNTTVIIRGNVINTNNRC